ADRNRSHWSTSKTPSYTKSVSWQHHPVNGGGIVERLFWDFDGKTIALPQVRKNYPYEVFVEWHRKEVFRG
ncbi:hypothetical protein, partial [Escherichia coli]|uniref:hypothetical protein n=1 Tax=Escherichia coli TaxID=562 RepID=UPI001F49F375